MPWYIMAVLFDDPAKEGLPCARSSGWKIRLRIVQMSWRLSGGENRDALISNSSANNPTYSDGVKRKANTESCLLIVELVKSSSLSVS